MDMTMTTDVLLRGPNWNRTIDALATIFKTRTNYSIFLLCLAIGIMYDQKIEKFDDAGLEPKNVPRNVIQNNDNGRLDMMFQAAILSTRTIEFSEEQRLALAFGEVTDFNKMGFLTQFANFGVTKLEELIGESPIESMENIKTFLTSTIDGNNFDIDAIPDDVWLDDL